MLLQNLIAAAVGIRYDWCFMGGTGGGYTDFTGGTPSTTCETLSFATNLLSTNPDVLATVRTGQILRIVRAGDYSVVAETETGEQVGSIVTNAARLLSCMSEGHAYVAEVLEIDIGACRVRVTYAGR